MGKTRLEELFYELYDSSKQHDSWQRYAMIRELRDLMKQPKASGSDRFERALDDEEVVETEVATELIGIEVATAPIETEDRAVTNEASATMISAIDKEEPIPQLQIPDSQKNRRGTELPQHPVGGTIISHLSPLVPKVQFQEDLVRMVDEVMGFAIDDCFRGTQLFDPGGFNCIKNSGVLLFGSHQLEAQIRGVLADSLIVGVARESQPEVLHHIQTLLLPYTFSGVAQTRVESPNTNRVWKPGGPYCETDLGVEMFPCLAAFGVALKQHFWYTIAELSDEERKRILHFVVVGGGPTGVEFAAELHDFVTEDLVSLYPKAKGSVCSTLLEAADHILTMFDKRITEFAEEKFSRDGIDVKLGSMVTKVNEKDISAKTKGGEVSSIPYGMIVWSTGIGTRPVIKDFMKQIGQGNRRALATDEWLRVEGCDNIYALGDCATINQRKVMEDVSAIFSKADKDKSGTLTLKEFQEAMDDICVRYPQVELYLKSKRMRGIADLLKEAEADDGSKKNVELKIEEFKSALSQVDSEVKFLPAC